MPYIRFTKIATSSATPPAVDVFYYLLIFIYITNAKFLYLVLREN